MSAIASHRRGRARAEHRAQRARLHGFRIGGHDRWHHTHIGAWRRGHEAAMGRHLAAAVKPGATVADVGAYIGYFALLAAARAGRSGRVIAFEPNPSSYEALVENIAINGLQDRVRPVSLALDSSSGLRRFAREPNPSQSRLARRDGAAIEVPCMSADQYFATAPSVPDVIKIDVEGNEPVVLAGMHRTLGRAGDRLVVVIECNPSALRRAGSSPGELLSALRALGLSTRIIDERSGRLIRADGAAIRSRPWVNLLCRRRRRS